MMDNQNNGNTNHFPFNPLLGFDLFDPEFSNGLEQHQAQTQPQPHQHQHQNQYQQLPGNDGTNYGPVGVGPQVPMAAMATNWDSSHPVWSSETPGLGLNGSWSPSLPPPGDHGNGFFPPSFGQDPATGHYQSASANLAQSGFFGTAEFLNNNYYYNNSFLSPGHDTQTGNIFQMGTQDAVGSSAHEPPQGQFGLGHFNQSLWDTDIANFGATHESNLLQATTDKQGLVEDFSPETLVWEGSADGQASQRPSTTEHVQPRSTGTQPPPDSPAHVSGTVGEPSKYILREVAQGSDNHEEIRRILMRDMQPVSKEKKTKKTKKPEKAQKPNKRGRAVDDDNEDDNENDDEDVNDSDEEEQRPRKRRAPTLHTMTPLPPMEKQPEYLDLDEIADPKERNRAQEINNDLSKKRRLYLRKKNNASAKRGRERRDNMSMTMMENCAKAQAERNHWQAAAVRLGADPNQWENIPARERDDFVADFRGDPSVLGVLRPRMGTKRVSSQDSLPNEEEEAEGEAESEEAEKKDEDEEDNWAEIGA